MFSSLSVPNYRLYWSGMFISLTGNWIQIVALSWLVFQLTNSAFLLGVVGFLSSIPIFLFSLFGGVIADRMNKRNVLLFTQVVFMALAFILAILTQIKLITPGQIMLIAVLNGTIMAFDAPSRQAMVVELVGKKHLMNAIALNSVAFNSSRIIGPALAGIFVSLIGMSGCFYINALSFIAVIIALLFINITKVRGAFGKSAGAIADLKEGLMFIRDNPLILILVAMIGIMSLFGTSYAILMPIFANDILKVGVKGLGILMSSAGVGAVIASLVLARLGDFKYKGYLLIISSLVFSLSLILFSFSRSYLLSIFSLILMGWGNVSLFALVNTILQSTVKDEFRGRIMSVYMFTFAGMMPFGNLISGSLASKTGAPFAVMLGGVICLILFLAIGIRYSDLRRL
ncbi:MAG: MFS transporter [Candidatus Omnitrophota bacterium]